MKSWPAAFVAAASDKNGAAPVWIVKLVVDGVSYYIGDRAVSIASWNGGVTLLPWVESWGKIIESLGSGLNEIRVAETDLTLIIDHDASPNMEDLVTQHVIESGTAEIYLWFEGLDPITAPPQVILSGAVRSNVKIPDDLHVDLSIEDSTYMLNGYVGTKITRAVYPDCDPDDIGMVEPIIYNTVERLPARGIVTGSQTSLPGTISATVISFSLSDVSGLSVGSVIQIDDEQMLIGSVSGNTVSVTRGYNSTVAENHLLGAVAWEHKNEFVYLAATHPIDTFDAVIGVVGQAEVDITAVSTLYTGQTGDEHPSYPGKAIISLPGYITVSQAVDLLVNDGITIDDARDLVDTIAINNYLSISDTIGVSDTTAVSDSGHDHSGSLLTTMVRFDTYADTDGVFSSSNAEYAINDLTTSGARADVINTSKAQANFRLLYPFSAAGTPTRYRFAFVTGFAEGGSTDGDLEWSTNGSYGYSLHTISYTVARTTNYSSWYTISSWEDLNDIILYIAGGAGSEAWLWETWIEVEYDTSTETTTSNVALSGGTSLTGGVDLSGDVDKTGGVSLVGELAKQGTVTLSGNSVANTLVGDTVLVFATRSMANSDVFDDILLAAGLPAVSISGTLPASFLISGAITEYLRGIDWCVRFAFQLRSYFRMMSSVPTLLVRELSAPATVTVDDCRVSKKGRHLSREKAPIDDVINVINLQYNRDWSMVSGDDAYRSTLSGSDAQSIADYGESEQPDQFLFDFVVNDDHAADLLTYYLGRYSQRPWRYTFEHTLQHAALEFGDTIALGFLSGQSATIIEARHSPGDLRDLDAIEIVCEDTI